MDNNKKIYYIADPRESQRGGYPLDHKGLQEKKLIKSRPHGHKKITRLPKFRQKFSLLIAASNRNKRMYGIKLLSGRATRCRTP